MRFPLFLSGVAFAMLVLGCLFDAGRGVEPPLLALAQLARYAAAALVAQLLTRARRRLRTPTHTHGSPTCGEKKVAGR